MNNQNNIIEQENMEEALQQVEQEVNMEQDEAYTGAKIRIKVKNAMGGEKTELDVYENNILHQIYERTAETLGFDKSPNKKFGAKTLYLNDINQSTADSELTLKEFGIGEGSMLTIIPDGGVA